jgi:hypothetical protein
LILDNVFLLSAFEGYYVTGGSFPSIIWGVAFIVNAGLLVSPYFMILGKYKI